MDSKELAAAMGKPQMARLKAIGSGIKVGRVMGSRILVKTIVPRTEMDAVEERGLITVPKWVKKDNTPLPTTGIILQLGEGAVGVFEEGDMVMFPKFSGSDFTIENEDLRILEAKEIMCTLVDTQDSVTEVLLDQ